MGTHDRELTGERERTIEGGVVLRFPGDWVGPLEELVPFGPSADRDVSPGQTEGDFWGEDSAALQDAVEAPPQPRPVKARSNRVRHRLLAGSAVAAAVLVGVALFLGGQGSRAPNVHGVTFAIANIPPLAPAATGAGKRIIHIRRRHRAGARSRSRATFTHSVLAGSDGGGPSPTVTATSPAYHPGPAPARASSGESSSSQSGGAFTLGGP